MTARAAIAAGGTGGHFYPGFALAQALKERGWEVLMIVKSGDRALPALEKYGMAYLEVPASGLQRRWNLQILSSAWKSLKSFLILRRALFDFKADIAVGMGGYLGFPLIAAAKTLGLPSIVHESNAALGLSNKLCRFLGAVLFWGLPPENGEGRGKVALSGTPIRQSLWETLPQTAARSSLGLEAETPTLLVFGGSQGAQAFNRLIPKIIRNLAGESRSSVQVIHLCGKNGETETKEGYAGAPFRVVIRPFLDEMEKAYGAADLVLCRSGASTLAELAAQKKPAVLIPYPFAAAGHQAKNAAAFERLKVARTVSENEIETRLPALFKELLFSKDCAKKRAEMAEAYGKAGLPESRKAAEFLADAAEKTAEAGGKKR